MLSMTLFLSAAVSASLLFSLLGPANAFAESPITRMDPDYVCTLSSGPNQVAFRFPSPKAPSKFWITNQGSAVGLETQVSKFAFNSCVGCYEIEGKYTFVGSTNLVFFETTEYSVEVPADPVVASVKTGATKFFSDDELPPGSEEGPPGSGDSAPGSDDGPPGSGNDGPPGSEDPADPGSPVQPGEPTEPRGSILKVNYYETTEDGRRKIYEGEGLCMPQARVPSVTAKSK